MAQFISAKEFYSWVGQKGKAGGSQEKMRAVFWWHVIQHRNKVTEDLPMCTSVLT